MVERTLYIIGNGFDLAHGLPTNIDPDFKEIALKYDNEDFWNIYGLIDENGWAELEDRLGAPDFDYLIDQLSEYMPDYLSDRESDRNAIITESDDMGNLNEALSEFAMQAEKEIDALKPKMFLSELLCKQDVFINFNYTHTIERIYGISENNVLHVHGEVGGSKLLLGYPEEEFLESLENDINSTMLDIKVSEDYYQEFAYQNIFHKIKSFSKVAQIELVTAFINKYAEEITGITVYGHSCKIDFPYFKYLNKKLLALHWSFYVYDKSDKESVNELIEMCGIESSELIKMYEIESSEQIEVKK